MKVFWHQCGSGSGNLGDRLTPLLLDYFNIPVQWAPPRDSELLGIGSILQQTPPAFKGIVWSSGFLNAAPPVTLPHARILALRGHHSLAQLQPGLNPCLGDGGLLCHLFHKPARPRFKLGLIPHYTDARHPAVLNWTASRTDATVIDICAGLDAVIHDISRCEAIVSSSLHGLIIADALRIPNHWVQLDDSRVLGSGFKFRDYYSCYEINDPAPAPFTGQSTLDQLLPLVADYHRPGLDRLQCGLLQSLEVIAAEQRRPHWQLGRLPVTKREQLALRQLDQSPPPDASELQPASQVLGADPKALSRFAIASLRLLARLRQHGVCHRDIRPETLMLHQNEPCLTGFGWSLTNVAPEEHEGFLRDLHDLGHLLERLNASRPPWLNLVIRLLRQARDVDEPQTFLHLFETAERMSNPAEPLPPQFQPAATLLRELERNRERLRRMSADLRTARTRLWDQEVDLLAREISGSIPAEEPFALLDQEQYRSALPPALIALPFPEQQGAYSGAPESDERVVDEVRRLKDSGVFHLVLVPSTFWWLDHYPGLDRVLQAESVPVVSNERVKIFRLKHPGGSRKPPRPSQPCRSAKETA